MCPWEHNLTGLSFRAIDRNVDKTLSEENEEVISSPELINQMVRFRGEGNNQLKNINFTDGQIERNAGLNVLVGILDRYSQTFVNQVNTPCAGPASSPPSSGKKKC